MRDFFERAVKASRYPLRIVVGLMAVLGLVVTFAGATGIAAALLGALFGLLAGEVLGRWKSVRVSTIAIALGIVVVLGTLCARVAVGWPLLPALIGPSLSLHLKTVLTLSTLAFSGLAMLRTLAVRRPSWRFVEIGVFSVCFVAAFAAHRDGSIARPLWLSDWAWRAGHDPSNVLLVIGAVFGVVCAVLLLLESKHRLSALTLGALPLLAVILLSVVDPKDLMPTAEGTDLEQIQSALEGKESVQDVEIPITRGTGDPPLPTDGGGHLIGPEGQDGQADAEGQGETEGEGDPTGDQGGEGETEGGEGDEGQSETGNQGEQPEGASEGEGDPTQGQPQGEGEREGGEPSEGEGQDGAADPAEGDPSEGEGEGEGDTPPDEMQPAEQPEMSFENSSQKGAPSPAAVVVFLDDYRTPSGYYYFRQKVMSEFGFYRYNETTRDDADRDVYPTFPTRVDRVEDPPPWEKRTRVRGRVAMLGEHDAPFALESPVLYLPSTNPNPDRFVSVYRFESLAQEIPYGELVGREARDPTWSDELLDYYLIAPADPRYEALKEEILGALPPEARADPFTRALAIKVHLDQRMVYTLDARYPGMDDPTAGFLFSDDKYVGYCVHAAHAAVYLWRLAGIPARVGTGYLVDESARRGSSLMVMGGDAHAWPELYLDGVGWIPMDISAAETLDPPGNPVDSDTTRILGEMVADAEDIQDETPPGIPFGLYLRRAALLAAFGVLLAALMGHYTVKVWRRYRPLMARPVSVPRVAYRACLDRLAEAGMVREEGETREAFARRVADIVPSFADITEMHVAAAFSRPTPDRGAGVDPAHWRAALSSLSDELVEHTPYWRRFLGAIDPSSVYRSR